MRFELKLLRYGVILWKGEVDATECGIVGVFIGDKVYEPNKDQTLSAIPYAYRKAFIRANRTWWASQMNDVMSVDLFSNKRKPMGTIVANFKNYHQFKYKA